MKHYYSKLPRGQMLVLMVVIAMAVWCVPETALAAPPNNSSNPGHYPEKVDVYYVPGSEDGSVEKQEALPEKYDSRNQPWYSGIRVKSQGQTNLCWAFSATTASEISYAKETGAYGAELSPGHLGCFFFNHVDDPLGNTNGDKNLSVDGSWIDEGGTNSSTMVHLSTWSGLCTEAKAPFSEIYDGYYAELAYDDEITEENSIYYNGYKKAVSVDTLKQLVYEHGAVVASIYTGNGKDIKWEDYVYPNEPEDGPYYFNPDGTEYSNNHEITVVGWNDKISAYNFRSIEHSSGETVMPLHDGAWIIQNSWGEAEGDKGFFYVSYDSDCILSDDITAFEMQPADSYAYNFQYDGNASTNTTLNLEKSEKCANVFQNTTGRAITLDAIGLTEYNQGTTKYGIDVYTCLSSKKDPMSGIKVASTTVSTDTCGFKTFKLPKPAGIAPGDTYSIVITTKSDETHFGLESDSYRKDSEGKEVQTRVAATKAGQSFYGDQYDWTDVAESNVCIRIKGLANDLNCLHPKTTKKTIKATKSTVGFNYTQCDTCNLVTQSKVIPMLDPKPNATSITGLTKAKKAFTVKWKKSDEIIRGDHINGYQIRYSLKSNMKSSKTVTVKGWKSTSKKITKLKAKKKYYVQVRTWYKDSKDKNWYSKWSAKKSVKTN